MNIQLKTCFAVYKFPFQVKPYDPIIFEKLEKLLLYKAISRVRGIVGYKKTCHLADGSSIYGDIYINYFIL